MSPSRASARTVSESMRTPTLKSRQKIFGLFHDQRNAEECAAKIAGARVERVVVRDKASREVLRPLIA
jgi:hypothetical protein